jgi:NAD(P)-dependent dehydrogenase (short-subunit alcohol dehydrogenase family)
MSTGPPVPDRFAGKVAMVVGAANGIGADTARRLSAEGATVVAVDVDGAGATAVSRELPGSIAFPMDVADERAVDRTVAAVVRQLGRIDLLAHVAGVDAAPAVKERLGAYIAAGATGGFEGIVAMDTDEWRRMLSINLDGVFFTNRAVGRQMIGQRSGSIVNVGSVTGQRATVGTGHYNASKAGVRILTQSLALELVGFGIRVNCVAPGPVETAMLARSRAAGLLGAAGNDASSVGLSTPTGRAAMPSEVAAAISYLLSDDAAYVIGEVLNVNGAVSTF